jgi:hypothetical protein
MMDTFLEAWRRAAVWIAATLGLIATVESHAQFAAAVTPPRFEISVEPGQVARQVIEITHAIPGSGSYRVYTTDWSMDAGGALTFYDTLQPGSCRPWVAIERRDITVVNGTRLRYRFPMNGRIGVIVYASIGAARAVLEADEVSIGTFDGRRVPLITVVNRGNATGRLSGSVKGVDPTGRTVEFSPESVPILPGQTRRIALHPFDPPGLAASAARPANVAVIQWPLALRGTLEYGPAGAGRIEIDRSVSERPAQ